MADNIAASPKLRDEPVTFKHVVYALPVIATALVFSGGWVVKAAGAKSEAVEQHVAKVEEAQKAIDAGVGTKIEALDKKFSRKFEKQDTKMNCLIDKRWCSAARELLSADGDP